MLKPEEVLEKARLPVGSGDPERMVEGYRAERAKRDPARERRAGSGSPGEPRKRVLKGSEPSLVDDPFAKKGR